MMENEILDLESVNKNPEKYLASATSRVVNFFLDRIGMFIFIFGLVTIFESSFFSKSNSETMDTFKVLIILFGAFGYWILFEFLLGKTPAKFITQTKVVSKNGTKPTFLSIVARTFCRLIPFEQFTFLNSKCVGLHDSLSGTRVVRNEFELNH